MTGSGPQLEAQEESTRLAPRLKLSWHMSKFLQSLLDEKLWSQTASTKIMKGSLLERLKLT